VQLTGRCDLWRMTLQPGGRKLMAAYQTRVPCLRVAISGFESLPAFARESSDVFFLPTWLSVRDDDEIRLGRRVDADAVPSQHRYTIDGLRRFEHFGADVLEAFVRTRE